MKQIKVKLYDGQITKNFSISEFKCKANGEVLLNAKVLDHINRLQKFRSWYKRSMQINSGYRTKSYNARCGGSPKSKHMHGIATDFLLPDEFFGFTKARQEEFLNNILIKWLDLCESDGLGGGVGLYDNFIHLDSRPKGNYRTGAYAFWDNRK